MLSYFSYFKDFIKKAFIKLKRPNIIIEYNFIPFFYQNLFQILMKISRLTQVNSYLPNPCYFQIKKWKMLQRKKTNLHINFLKCFIFGELFCYRQLR